MFKVNYYYITKLKNQEFPAAYEMICSMFKEDETSVEDVAQSFENVQAHIEKLRFLKNMKLQHPLTREIRRMTQQRNKYLRSLKGRVTSALLSPIESEREAAQVLDLWLFGYREYLSTARIYEQNALVGQMTHDFETKPAIQDAVSDAGVTSFMDSISAITEEIVTALVTRAKEKTAAKRKATVLRRDAYRDLKVFITSLQMTIALNKDDGGVYQNYLNEINDIMEGFKGKYESRSTRRKNAALEAEENQQGDDENEEQGGDGVPTEEQPEMTGKSRTLDVVTSNGMDSHNGVTNESLGGKSVMSASVTNGEAIGGEKEDPSIGNDTFVSDEGLKPKTAIAVHANAQNGSDQDSKNENLDR